MKLYTDPNLNDMHVAQDLLLAGYVIVTAEDGLMLTTKDRHEQKIRETIPRADDYPETAA